MITSVAIKNFRSIESMELSLGKINVLTGANNSGKSSVIYALLVLKNAVTNPNQSLDSILNLGFINLGGFKETVHRKDGDQFIDLGIKATEDDEAISYNIFLHPKNTVINLKISGWDVDAYMDLLSFPYDGQDSTEISSIKLPEEYTFLWNGISARVSRKNGSIPRTNEEHQSAVEANREKNRIAGIINLPLKELSSLDSIPLRRGFTKPQFNPTLFQPHSEDEIAAVLYQDRELASDVAHFLEKIVARRFSVVPVANTTNFYLQTRDEKTGFTADLVNEGLGTNQLVTILAKALYKGASFICIDEPEIHLHPSIIDKLVNVLIDIANERGKQFLISTHSEHFINSLLSAVIKKRITPDEVKVYHLTKEGWDTKAELQPINEQGQIGGVGLSQFYAAELEAWSTFFKLDEDESEHGIRH